MIEFVPGPHGEKVTAKEKKLITELLENCFNPEHFGNHVNIAYNNVAHFSSQQYDYDTVTFLRELRDMVQSTKHKVQVHGSIHTDPYGHSSSMIGQYNEYHEFMPCIVHDSYIRFKLVIDPKYMKKMNALNDVVFFHFLVQVPQVVHAQLGDYIPIVMYPIMDMNGNQILYQGILPKSNNSILIQYE